MTTRDSKRTSSPPILSHEAPWQLRMFRKTLKKQQKLKLLLEQIGEPRELACLLVTCGDNNGALNYHFRARGGRWTWVELEARNIPEIEQLLGDTVLIGKPDHLPAESGAFDLVVSIDVHEHLQEPAAFNQELYRVTRSGGRVIVTTPNGDPWKPVTLLKRALGMTKETYGHRVLGYNSKEHRQMLQEAGFETLQDGSYSKFFTEMLELAINFAYVKLLSKKRGQRIQQGTIAPTSHEQLRAVEKQVRLYTVVYPVLLTISKLDLLLFFFTGYAVSVVARKP